MSSQTCFDNVFGKFNLVLTKFISLCIADDNPVTIAYCVCVIEGSINEGTFRIILYKDERGKKFIA